MAPICNIGPYTILGELGRGGMGTVYRARDARLRRDVALKVLPEELRLSPTRLARFEQEARLVAALNHPNIAAIYGIEDGAAGVQALVLELVEGKTLATRIAEGRLGIAEVLTIARQIAQALDAAHEKGIVHRDLKPANIVITPTGLVKVLDFGVAKMTDPSDLATEETITAGLTREGVIVGTPAYMSPEQARGLAVDKRADIWAFGCVLYELLTGRRAMSGATSSDILAAVLTSEPDWSRVPPTTPPRVVGLVRRCLTKDPRERLRDIGDARFDLKESDSDRASDRSSSAARRTPAVRRVTLAALVLAAFAGLGAVMWPRSSPVDTWVNPLADATPTRITDFDGTETMASISADGKFIVFMSDRDGPMHIWLTQVGSGRFTDLTKNAPSLLFASRVRPLGFSGDGTEVWAATLSNETRLIPLTGGEPRPFLSDNAIHPSWSPDGASLAYFRAVDGDPIYVADRSGGNAREILKEEAGIHNHNPIWSPDGQWIYFVHGRPEAEHTDIRRIRPSGGPPETIFDSRGAVNFVAPLDSRTLLFVARADDLTGPWLWSLDVETRKVRRVTLGVEQYLSVAASADGRRIVTTVANPTASLWSLPILDREADKSDMRPFAVPSVRAVAPRFAGTTLFYLSSRGSGDGLWRFENGQTSEIWRGADGPLGEPAAISHDGQWVAIVIRRAGRGQIVVMKANGANARDIATSLDVQGTVDWAPDGSSIVAGAIDAKGPGLFLIPLDGGTIKRLANKFATSPVWSPDGRVIVYSGPNIAARQRLLGVTPDGMELPLPAIYLGTANGRGTPLQGYRFLPDGTGLIYTPAQTSDLEFWKLNLATRTTTRIAKLPRPDGIRSFDIVRDGKQIVFDRLRENGDIVLFERKESAR